MSERARSGPRASVRYRTELLVKTVKNLPNSTHFRRYPSLGAFATDLVRVSDPSCESTLAWATLIFQRGRRGLGCASNGARRIGDEVKSQSGPPRSPGGNGAATTTLRGASSIDATSAPRSGVLMATPTDHSALSAAEERRAPPGPEGIVPVSVSDNDTSDSMVETHEAIVVGAGSAGLAACSRAVGAGLRYHGHRAIRVAGVNLAIAISRASPQLVATDVEASRQGHAPILWALPGP